MKFLLKIRNIILTSLLVFAICTNAQFAPPAGFQGTTAIHKDSSVFVNWATSCEVELGPEDISNPQSPLVNTGSPSMAIRDNNGIVSLGDGGYAILSFENKIVNGTGWDFAVFENAFSDNFLELAFVEVSSNGVDYFRFPATSLTQDTIQIGPFDNIQNTEKINNLAGKYRANYGTPFDLDDLSEIEDLDINAISNVKLIDVVGWISDSYCSFDDLGNKINDPFPTAFSNSCFDLDAIGIIHQSQSNFIIQHKPETFIENIKTSNNFIKILLNHVTSQKINFSIVNLSGQIVLKSNQYYNPKNYNSININNLIRGLYVLHIEGGNLNESIKILIP